MAWMEIASLPIHHHIALNRLLSNRINGESEEMSLLTSDNARSAAHLIRKLVSHWLLLSILIFAAGLGYFGYLVNTPDQTYFSDHGLLAGLVTREFTLARLTEEHLKALQNVCNDRAALGNYLKLEFSKADLKFYSHQYRVKPLLNGLLGDNYNGTNYYALFKAPRASGIESMIISTPLKVDNNGKITTLPSIALMLSLASYFRSKNYWSKNIIFVIGDQDLYGLQAWLNAYHQPPDYHENAYLVHDTMFRDFGLIYSAINLEVTTFTPRTIDVCIEGMNGLLPNLDLFNVAIELLSRENVPATFHGSSFYNVPDEIDNFVRNLATVKEMMSTQASNRMNGAHGLFQRYAIPAITFKTVPKAKSDEFSIVTSVSIGRAIEGTIRSINNLQERFHRSYYFYLLPNTRRYISIGFYMISYGLLILPLALKSLQLYFFATEKIEEIRKAKRLDFKKNRDKHGFDLWSCFQASFMSHLSGIGAMFIPIVLSNIKLNIHMHPVDLTLSLFTAYLLINLVPSWIDKGKSESELALQAMVALLNTALFLGCLSLINISLAIILALVYVPSSLIIVSLQNFQPVGKSFVRRVCQLALLTIIHPIVLYTLLSYVSRLRLDAELYARFDWNHLLRNADVMQTMVEVKQSLVGYIEEWYYLNNWTFPIVTLFWFPIWLQFYFMCLSYVQ